MNNHGARQDPETGAADNKEVIALRYLLSVSRRIEMYSNKADFNCCLLYTSDAADELNCVNIGDPSRVITCKQSSCSIIRYTTCFTDNTDSR